MTQIINTYLNTHMHILRTCFNAINIVDIKKSLPLESVINLRKMLKYEGQYFHSWYNFNVSPINGKKFLMN